MSTGPDDVNALFNAMLEADEGAKVKEEEVSQSSDVHMIDLELKVM